MYKIVISIILLISVSSLIAQDLVEWRGSGRTGIYPDTGLLKEWPEGGPELVLEINGIGGGYSSPVVFNNVIYVTGVRDSIEMISAFKLNGEKIWAKDYGKAWFRTFSDNRCTPTIENGKIYLISGMGEVVCLNADNGEINWSVDAQKMYAGAYANWGIAESVLLTDKAVIYTTGGEENAVIALSKEDGSLLWTTKSLGGTRAYASPLLIEKADLKLILAQTANHLLALNEINGEIVWSFNLHEYHPGRIGVGANTNTPLFYNNEIFLTSGYNHPALMLSLAEDGKSVSLKWQNEILDCHYGGVVMVDGKIYGSNWENNSNGNWACIDWETGQTMYDHTWNNKGAVIAADNMLYIYEEKSGNVGLLKPNPEKFDLVSSFKIEKGTGPHWAHPAIFDGKLFIRHGDALMIYNIKA